MAILDVGHGNTAVLFDENGIVVIDAGPGSSLLEFLTEQNVQQVDVVLLSHADQDHIAGLIGLLASGKFRVSCVRLNTDSLKGSALWDDLVYELGKAHDAGEIDFQPVLARDSSGQFDRGKVHIEILAPSSYLASKGAGSVDKKQRKLTTNSMSAVIRLCINSKPIALFPGDIDQVALDNILEEDVNLHAPIVVFPHHGGKPGTSDSFEFTRSFCEAAAPSHVVFSIGRGVHGTPRQEVVDTIHSTIPMRESHAPNYRNTVRTGYQITSPFTWLLASREDGTNESAAQGQFWLVSKVQSLNPTKRTIDYSFWRTRLRPSVWDGNRHSLPVAGKSNRNSILW